MPRLFFVSSVFVALSLSACTVAAEAGDMSAGSTTDAPTNPTSAASTTASPTVVPNFDELKKPVIAHSLTDA